MQRFADVVLLSAGRSVPLSFRISVLWVLPGGRGSQLRCVWNPVSVLARPTDRLEGAIVFSA